MPSSIIGRPRHDIDMALARKLVEGDGLSIRQAAKIMGVYHNTLIYRFKKRRRKYRHLPETKQKLSELARQRTPRPVPDNFSEIMSLRLRNAQARGVRVGRPSTFQLTNATCHYCASNFQFKLYKSIPPKRYCSRQCSSLDGTKVRKIPNDFTLLYTLYWDDGLSTRQIGERYNAKRAGVLKVLHQLNVPVKKLGRQTASTCIIFGCDEPVYKVVHSKNQRHYGRRCLIHWTLYRQQARAERYRQLKEAKGNNFIAAVECVVSKSLPYEIRDEVCQELILALLSGDVTTSDLHEAAQRITRRAFQQSPNKYGPLSLDAPLGYTEGFTLGHLIATEYR